MKKTFPTLKSDKEAERFVDEADLSEYDFSAFTHVRFEFMPKTKHVNLRIPEPLLQQVKARAKQEGIPYQRYIRLVVEKSLSSPLSPHSS
jgi:predicted DNA binding CopG/RHH family protein